MPTGNTGGQSLMKLKRKGTRVGKMKIPGLKESARDESGWYGSDCQGNRRAGWCGAGSLKTTLDDGEPRAGLKRRRLGLDGY